VVVVEGTAHEVTAPDWKQRAIDLYDAKYEMSYASYWDHGTIEVRPTRAHAWRVDGSSTHGGTRYVF
jgi:hypothetical protein